MSVLQRVPEPNIWQDICKAFAAETPPFKDDDAASVTTELLDYDPAKHNPVFFGKMHKKIAVDDADVVEDFDPAVSHPAALGYTLLDRPLKSPPPTPPQLPDHKTCSPREYLETFIFPILLPVMEDMLRQAKLERCFERKRTKFNALDFLTENMYRRNPKYSDRDDTTLEKIPFVEEHWKHHPRPPLPKSLLWTEGEATLILQSFFRGYKARLDPEIQELRQWQKEWREENANIKNKVNDFWAKQMPEGASPSPTGSEVNIPEKLEEAITLHDTMEEEVSRCIAEPMVAEIFEDHVAELRKYSSHSAAASDNEDEEIEEFD